MGYVNSKKYGSFVQLYKKSNGDVSLYITYKDLENKLKRIKIGEKSNGITEHYCNRKRAEIVNKIRLGEDPHISSRKKVFTFKDAYDDYIIWAKGNKISWSRDELLFRLHMTNLHSRGLIHIKPKDFEELKQEKLKTLAVRTVEYLLAVARQIINHAIKNELVRNYQNPISGGRVKLPRPDNAKVAFLTKEQAEQLFDILKKRESRVSYYLTILLLYTGGRFKEVATLTWNDIHFQQRLIYFKSTKNGNPRYVYMTDFVEKILRELPRINHLVLPAENYKNMERMPRQWQLLVDDMIPGNTTAGKYRITVHSLRHTHASWMAIAGANILQIKEQLGHKKLDMTLRYAHLIPSERHDMIKKIFDS